MSISSVLPLLFPINVMYPNLLCSQNILQEIIKPVWNAAKTSFWSRSTITPPALILLRAAKALQRAIKTNRKFAVHIQIPPLSEFHAVDDSQSSQPQHIPTSSTNPFSQPHTTVERILASPHTSVSESVLKEPVTKPKAGPHNILAMVGRSKTITTPITSMPPGREVRTREPTTVQGEGGRWWWGWSQAAIRALPLSHQPPDVPRRMSPCAHGAIQAISLTGPRTGTSGLPPGTSGWAVVVEFCTRLVRKESAWFWAFVTGYGPWVIEWFTGCSVFSSWVIASTTLLIVLAFW